MVLEAFHDQEVTTVDGHREELSPSASSSIPIHWQHRRYESYASVGPTKPPPITLEDNTEDAPDIKSPLWAKAVEIDDHVVVSGSIKGVGDYTIWNCKIDTLNVSSCWEQEWSCSAVHCEGFSGMQHFDSLQGGSMIIRKRSVSFRAHMSGSDPPY